MAGATVTAYATYSRKELRIVYGIGKDTFRVWCRLAGIEHSRRILSPADVRQFVEHHGEPEGLLKEGKH